MDYQENNPVVLSNNDYLNLSPFFAEQIKIEVEDGDPLLDIFPELLTFLPSNDDQLLLGDSDLDFGSGLSHNQHLGNLDLDIGSGLLPDTNIIGNQDNDLDFGSGLSHTRHLGNLDLGVASDRPRVTKIVDNQDNGFYCGSGLSHNPHLWNLDLGLGPGLTPDTKNIANQVPKQELPPNTKYIANQDNGLDCGSGLSHTPDLWNLGLGFALPPDTKNIGNQVPKQELPPDTKIIGNQGSGLDCGSGLSHTPDLWNLDLGLGSALPPDTKILGNQVRQEDLPMDTKIIGSRVRKQDLPSDTKIIGSRVRKQHLPSDTKIIGTLVRKQKPAKKRSLPRKTNQRSPPAKPSEKCVASAKLTTVKKGKKKKLMTPEERAHHNQLERERRKGIAVLLDRLKGLVPAVKDNKKASQKKIIEEATSYLKGETRILLSYLIERQRFLRLEARRRQMELELTSGPHGFLCVWENRKGMSPDDLYTLVKKEAKEDITEEEVDKTIRVLESSLRSPENSPVYSNPSADSEDEHIEVEL